MCVKLLVGQWRAGASVLQVFESSGGELPPHLFREFALPYMVRVAEGVRAQVPPVAEGGPPIIAFPRCVHDPSILESIASGPFDAISLDWGWEPALAVERVKQAAARAGRAAPVALQGNLDPTALHAPRLTLLKETRRMLEGFGDHSLVANLGHGMAPSHEPAKLALYFDAVHAISARMREAPGKRVTDEELAEMEKTLGKSMVVPEGMPASNAAAASGGSAGAVVGAAAATGTGAANGS